MTETGNGITLNNYCKQAWKYKIYPTNSEATPNC